MDKKQLKIVTCVLFAAAAVFSLIYNLYDMDTLPPSIILTLTILVFAVSIGIDSKPLSYISLSIAYVVPLVYAYEYELVYVVYTAEALLLTCALFWPKYSSIWISAAAGLRVLVRIVLPLAERLLFLEKGYYRFTFCNIADILMIAAIIAWGMYMIPAKDAAALSATSIIEKLTQLNALRESGIITQEEFETKKAEILK